MLKRLAVIFTLGGSAYVCIELLYRGYSHISMFIAGGSACAVIHLVCNVLASVKKRCIAVKCLLGGAIITSVELVTGLIVNRKMGLDVWDYSEIPFNFMGQICARLSVIWILLTLPVLALCKVVCVFTHPRGFLRIRK